MRGWIISWTKPRTSQDIPYVSKDVVEREVKGNLDYLKDAADDIATNTTNIATNTGKFDDCAQRDGSTVAYASPSGTRAKSTVYENTSGKIRFITIMWSADAINDAVAIYVEDANPPTVRVSGNVAIANNQWFTETFVVPAGWFYKANEETATITIQDWVEWDLH